MYRKFVLVTFLVLALAAFVISSPYNGRYDVIQKRVIIFLCMFHLIVYVGISRNVTSLEAFHSQCGVLLRPS